MVLRLHIGSHSSARIRPVYLLRLPCGRISHLLHSRLFSLFSASCVRISLSFPDYCSTPSVRFVSLPFLLANPLSLQLHSTHPPTPPSHLLVRPLIPISRARVRRVECAWKRPSALPAHLPIRRPAAPRCPLYTSLSAVTRSPPPLVRRAGPGRIAAVMQTRGTCGAGGQADGGMWSVQRCVGRCPAVPMLVLPPAFPSVALDLLRLPIAGAPPPAFSALVSLPVPLILSLSHLTSRIE